MKQKYVYWVFPLIGIVFCLWYVRAATYDVIYSDYVRLVNSYLPDVFNPDKFFVPDLLTRIPVNYLGRMINTAFFDFTITFDRILGVLGLGLSALVCTSYCVQRRVGTVWFTLVMVLVFSLNKWEMLTNGSGWSHFMAFAGFYYHYLVIDRVYRGEEKNWDRVRLVALPFLITLLLAGPYCAIYSVTVILTYVFILVTDYFRGEKPDRHGLIAIACTAIPLFLYMISNSLAVEDHSGAVSQPLMPVLLDTPSFFVRFLLKSFASMVMGEEVMRAAISSDTVILVIGAVVLAAYLLALWLNFRCRLYRRSLFPFMLLAAGGLNHVLILVSRWIFLEENYGMSSRYALQYQIGILGIVLTFALVWGKLGETRSRVLKTVSIGFCLIFAVGNLYTTCKEWEKAPYRKESFERIAAVARNFEQETDTALRDVFEYRKKEEGSGAKIRAALTILKENGWNIFREDGNQEHEEGKR